MDEESIGGGNCAHQTGPGGGRRTILPIKCAMLSRPRVGGLLADGTRNSTTDSAACLAKAKNRSFAPYQFSLSTARKKDGKKLKGMLSLNEALPKMMTRPSRQMNGCQSFSLPRVGNVL
jgi:hypothetical protein